MNASLIDPAMAQIAVGCGRGGPTQHCSWLILDDAPSDLGEHGHAKRILFCEIARYGPEHRAVLGSLDWYLRLFAVICVT